MDDHEGVAQQHEATDIQIIASDEDLKGRYANLMSVSHTGEEFVLDFFAVTPSSSGTARGNLVGRMITSPAHFKRIVVALEDNLRKHEAEFGEIQEARGQLPNPEDFVH